MLDKEQICTSNLRFSKPLPFGAKMMTAIGKYYMELDSNLRMLVSKYPNETPQKLKELLEELENNIQMVQDVLDEQEAKQATQSKMKQLKADQKPRREPCSDPDKKTLKKAVASLVKKLDEKNQSLAQRDKEIATLREENERLRRENEFYKGRSSMLAREQLNSEFDRNMDIF